MKRTTTAFAAVLTAALALPAHAETLSEKTGVNSALGIAPTTQDFVHEAAVSDLFEVGSSKLAVAQTDGPTKAFAEKMVTDHTKTTEELKPLAEQAHVAPPTTLDEAHQKMLDKLTSLKGNDFVKQYHEDQDKGHKDAVSLFERYAQSGENPELKAWAGKTLPDLKAHLQMAENLDK